MSSGLKYVGYRNTQTWYAHRIFHFALARMMREAEQVHPKWNKVIQAVTLARSGYQKLGNYTDREIEC